MSTSIAPLNLNLALPRPFSDSRKHGYKGPTRLVRLPRATTSGGGAIAVSGDNSRCAVAGKESLRILRFYDPTQSAPSEHKSSLGRGGHRIDSSRNFWDGSGLKIDSASTDVAWGCTTFSNKILTSARNGELIMWDLNQSGPNKYERKSRDHLRSINKLSVSQHVEHYCITGSSDGDVRVWDLRNISKSLMRIHHPTSVRHVIFSPSCWQPLQALVGLDNGSIYRWDLKMGQRGQLDRLPVAHTGPIMALDWYTPPAGNNTPTVTSGVGTGLGWIASGGLDRCVKVWNLTAAGSYPHIPYKATYTLHPSFPVRRVLWRPSYDCELAIVSNEEFGTGSNHEPVYTLPRSTQRVNTVSREDPSTIVDGALAKGDKPTSESKSSGGDAVEIWDVRREWIAKWSVTGSAIEGGVTDIAFADSHAVWAQHLSGMFSQLDLRDCTKPIEAIPRVAVTWEASGSLAFVSDKIASSEIPYDDVPDIDEPMTKFKVVGDPPSIPPSQSIGTFRVDPCQDLVAFSKLAENYSFKGDDREDICSHNADVAFQNGRYQAARVWLLLKSLLTDLVLNPQPTRLGKNAPLPHSPALPKTPEWSLDMEGKYTFPPPQDSILLRSDPVIPRTPESPSRSSPRSGEPPNSLIFRKKTPTSSNSSSPLFLASALPSTRPRPSSLQRELDSCHPNPQRRQSILRRPSISEQNSSPSSSLRHVGEGALADSDSSSSGSTDGKGGKGPGDGEKPAGSPAASPAVNPTGLPPAHPSPLSRVANRQRWTQDEGEENREKEVSPSPRSANSGSASSGSPSPRSRGSGRNSGSAKARSRSATSASTASSLRPLVKQESHSSIRTVIAGDLLLQEEPLVKSPVLPTSTNHARKKSQALSELVLNPEDHAQEPRSPDRASQLTDRRRDIVNASEQRYRELGWETLRSWLESLADEGDVQMCALLSLVAPRELKLGQKRTIRFLDSYIDLLLRLRLYTPAASLRKYSGAESLGAATQLGTTIHFSCGKCQKPFPYLAGVQKHRETKGFYAYCQSCRTYSVRCSICRCPVRTLLFQCSVCKHGGHQECYKWYKMEHPMEEIPSFAPLPPAGTRTPVRGNPLEGTDGSDNDTIAGTDEGQVAAPRIRQRGRKCAAGCGHFCWVAKESRVLS